MITLFVVYLSLFFYRWIMAAHSAVGDDGLSANVTGIFRCQECNDAGNVLRLSGVWQRVVLPEVIPLFWCEILNCSRGEDQTWCHTVAADAKSAVLGCNIAGEVYYACFANTVQCAAQVSQKAAY